MVAGPEGARRKRPRFEHLERKARSSEAEGKSGQLDLGPEGRDRVAERTLQRGLCHLFGRRRFATEDESTNVFWLAIPSLGESWHHNHHAFPRAAQQGLRWYEIDISAAIITAMEKLGLARNVIRISPERQEQRLVGAPGAGAAPRRLAIDPD